MENLTTSNSTVTTPILTMNLYEMYLYCMLSLYSDYVSERMTWNNDGHVEYEILGAAVLDSNFEMLSFLQF